ncbi:MAG: hypothetical protein VR70_07055 [Rhodospirillaceae bacterium BRH_c57]|nr:MAG: hypothetical protein VR70_07055 [Rhodospirillaceae bacterium BRH_c57]
MLVMLSPFRRSRWRSLCPSKSTFGLKGKRAELRHPLTAFDEETKVAMAKSMLRGLLRREIGQMVNLVSDRAHLPRAQGVMALLAAMPRRQADEPVSQWLERAIRALRTNDE